MYQVGVDSLKWQLLLRAGYQYLQQNSLALAPEAGEIPETRAVCEVEERGENPSALGTAIEDVGEPAKTIV